MLSWEEEQRSIFWSPSFSCVFVNSVTLTWWGFFTQCQNDPMTRRDIELTGVCCCERSPIFCVECGLILEEGGKKFHEGRNKHRGGGGGG